MLSSLNEPTNSQVFRNASNKTFFRPLEKEPLRNGGGGRVGVEGVEGWGRY